MEVICPTHALNKVVEEGGKIIVNGGVLSGEGYESGCYVKPAIAEASCHTKNNPQRVPEGLNKSIKTSINA